ncbi:hypothetical protein [uncultured Roseobacter sp.]|uniref:hypothetical protein n=1 Tax=uncultured Roseobacter sp. TaxID=114847 RepID=UPI002616726E|nr:hypothetical protein [uncultured Roseobacter sp.]
MRAGFVWSIWRALRRTLYIEIPRQEAQLLANWKLEHPINVPVSEVRSACKTLVDRYRSQLEVAFWRSPRSDLTRFPYPSGVEDVEAELLASITKRWPTELSIEPRVEAMTTQLMDCFQRNLGVNLPLQAEIAQFCAERLEASEDRIRAAIDQRQVQEELRRTRERRFRKAKANVDVAVRAELDHLKNGSNTWTRNLIMQRIEPKSLRNLFRFAGKRRVNYADLGAGFVNNDYHLEDQMFFGVDLVISPDGHLGFEVEPSQGGGLLNALRRWQEWR